MLAYHFTIMTRSGVKYLLPFDRLHGMLRVPLKWIIFLAVVVVVCYPYPNLLAKHVRHWRDPNALLDPNEPALQPLVEELRTSLPDDLTPPDVLKRVQKFVLAKVPYGWDWETWGMADYLPTVAEALAMGREDCDGRAVVAASLLRALGHEATIVTDFSHVWVRTPKGDLMGPGRADAVVATERGLSVHWRGLAQIPHALAYGIAVFPQGRELIIVVAAWWLLLRRRTELAKAAAALVLLSLGLTLLRMGGIDYMKPERALQYAGLGMGLAGALVLLWPKRRESGSTST